MKNIVRSSQNPLAYETRFLNGIDKKLHPAPKVEQPKPKELSPAVKFYRVAKDAFTEWMASAVAPVPQLVSIRVEPARLVFTGSPAKSAQVYCPRRKCR